MMLPFLDFARASPTLPSAAALELLFGLHGKGETQAPTSISPMEPKKGQSQLPVYIDDPTAHHGT